METMEQEISIETWRAEFGPEKFGVELLIDPEGVPNEKVAVVDVEDNEKGVFVGIGVMCDPNRVAYYTNLRPDLREYLSGASLIGHNIKSDARKLCSWGVPIRPEQLVHDTMLKSYVRSSTKESHGLKELCREYLSMEWPTYDQMTVEGTLDTRPVEQVAAYCGDDCIATWRLNAYFDKMMTPEQRGYYNNIELPTLQLLFKMEMVGVTVDVDYLKALKVDFELDAVQLLTNIRQMVVDRQYVIKCRKSCPKKAHEHEFNPGSPKQVLEALNAFGIPVQATAKADLAAFKADEFISMLLEYRKINKTIGTFLEAWLALPTLPKIHTTFSQVSFDDQTGDWKGIRTGRLSSKEPNLQQISKAGDENEETTGKALRSAFIPEDPEKELWIYDYDQFQYRILAHYTKEPGLIKAFQRGDDVHEETARILLEKSTVTSAERKLGKGLNFGAVFGSQPEKIAEIAGCTLAEAEKFYKLYWQRLPYVARWINRTKMLAHVHKNVRTIFGRVIPLPDIDSRNMYERMHAERTAVNYIIQGSEADIIKLGMLQVDRAGFMPKLQVHDELHFEGYPRDREANMPKIQSILENVVKLDVPVIANGGYGANWFAAK